MRQIDRRRYPKVLYEQKKRYYEKTQYLSGISQRRKWTAEEEEMIMRHEMTDHEMAIILKRSVRAIQGKRYKLKKELRA